MKKLKFFTRPFPFFFLSELIHSITAELMKDVYSLVLFSYTPEEIW